jgi:hypothetical protein
MNIGDKIFLLYTHRETKDTFSEGPSTITNFLVDPHNDEGVIVIKGIGGKSRAVNLEGTSSHEVDIHFIC